MSDFLNFLAWVVVVLFVFIFVVGFNRQMMEKNRIRDEMIAKAKQAKQDKEIKKDE